MKVRLQFITPGFCSGANPLEAEIRSASIRGELRWWFRCLGGTPDQEKAVFGAAAGRGNSSSCNVRVSNQERSKEIYSPDFISPNDPQAYHNHYLHAAPKVTKLSRLWKILPDVETKRKGAVREDSQIPPGSSFDLHLRLNRSIPDDASRRLFTTAVDCFLHFGSIGYRMTRGFGAWMAPEHLCFRGKIEEKLNALSALGFSHELLPAANADALQVLRQVEGRLKGDKQKQSGLRFHHPAETKKSPLGYSHGAKERQTSAVRFRPCAFLTKKGDAQFSLLILQAPDSVLGEDVKQVYAGRTRIIPEK